MLSQLPQFPCVGLCVDSSFFGVWFISGWYLLWLCCCLCLCFCGGCVLFGLILRVKLLDGMADDLRWSVVCGE